MLNVIPKLEKGYEKVTKIIQAGGITTIADMEVCIYKFIMVLCFKNCSDLLTVNKNCSSD